LAGCAALLLVKRVPWTPGLGLLAGVALSCLVAGWLAGKSRDVRSVRGIAWLEAAVLWIAWAAMAFDWYAATRGPRGVEIAPGRPVVCLGDSMTSMGPPHGGYPEDLAGLVTIPVVNLGQPGITTRQALGLLDRLAAADPEVVVLELGGNDFIQGQSRQTVKDNLEQIIVACRERGAEVILMEVPRGFFSDPYWGLERQLARQYRLELIPDTAIRRLLLSSPTMPPGQWTSGPFLTQGDGLHPNAGGNQLLAAYVAAALERIYGAAIRLKETE
jgi:lysophospholipase L1-like esterase